MRRSQRRVLMVSVVLILVLALALVCFLWVEYQRDREALASLETKRQEQLRESGTGEEASEEGQEQPKGPNAGEGTPEEGQMPEPGEGGNYAPGETDGPAPGETDGSVPGEAGADSLSGQEERPVTLFFTGDIMLDQANVKANYDREGISGILSDSLLTEMQQADITVVNEEFPFSARGTQAPDKQFTFRADPSYVSAFLDMGVDVASLANNHALDYGTEALSDTFATLDGAGIPYAGAGETRERAAQPIYLNRGGMTVGVLAASRVIPVVSWNIDNQQPGMFCTYDSAQLVAAIRAAKENCDYVAVYVHWGVERKNTPEEYQRQLAQDYIDAGADLVVGSHPHVPQGIEYYNGKPIVYSLGNFIFNSSGADTYALKAVVTAEGNTELTVIPVGATEAKTSMLEGAQRQALLELLQSISAGASIDGEGRVTPAA